MGEVMGGWWSNCVEINAPARFMLSYLIHFFDFVPFFRTRTGTGFPPLFPCRGDGVEEEEVTGPTRRMRVRW